MIVAAVWLAVGWIGVHSPPAEAVSFGDLPLRVENAVARHNEALAEFRIVLVAKQVGSSETPLCEDPQLLRLIATCVEQHMGATNAYNEIQSRLNSETGAASMENQRALDRASRLIGQLEPLHTSGVELARAGICDPYRVAINIDQQHTEDQKAREIESRQERADFLDELVNEALRDGRRAPSGESESERAIPSSDWDHGRFSNLYLRYEAASAEFKQSAADFLDRLDLLSANGEEICHDQVLAYSYSESQRTGAALAQIFEAIFGMVYPMVPSAAHQMVLSSPGAAELYSHLPIEDQVAFAEVASDFQNMSIVFDFIGAELSAKAEGCDPEELADQGNRTAEKGQDPETGIDAGEGSGTPGGGPAGLTANFAGSPTSGDAPLVVQFTDLSSGGEIDSWNWTFGDGGASTEENPSHTFHDEGTWTVSLTVTGPDGSDTETKSGYIAVGSGDLRYTRFGEVFIQEDTRADCDGGTMSLEVTSDPNFPAEVRPDGSYTINVTVSWSASGSRLEDFGFAVVVFFFNAQQESETVETLSGTRTFRFTFDGSGVDFSQQAGAITVIASGGIFCEGGTSDGATTNIVQSYTRRGGN